MINQIIKFIKNLYSQQECEVETLDRAYFHEDDFRQIEFLPRDNYEFLQNENLTIKNFADEHSDGFGFTDIHIREENQKSIADQKIELSDLNSVLLELELEKIEEVFTGYGNHKEKCPNTIAYKFDRAEIFVVTEEKTVTDFFVTGFRHFDDAEIKIKLENILFQIGTKYNLVLNDWDLAEMIDLHDRKEIEKYLNGEL